MTRRATFTLEDETLAFLNEEQRRLMEVAILKANREEAKDSQYQEELSLWDVTVADGSKRQMTINMFEGDNRLKNIFKDAIVEVLEERQDLFAEIVAEDIGLVRAIQEGEKTVDVSREEIFRVLQGE